MRKVVLGFMVSILTICSANSQPFQGDKLFKEQIAPLLEGMGVHNFEISSKEDLAYIFFNQAIALTYGFNHLEAHRSYEQVASIDPKSGIAYWGMALVLGPNLNAKMEASAVKPAYEAIQKAKGLVEYASEKEKGLIEALSKRYSNDETLSDRVELDYAYADAMRALAKKHPNDPHIQTLLAEALMVIHAWDFWTGDGKPKEWTPEILEVLETGLENNPRHAGLIHYYIHAVEASKRPGRALQGADILADLVPGAGHLVHMPSHIYIRTGKYQEGVEVNEKAILVDNEYITQCRQQGIYPVAYVPHNRHFLWAMATMQGNSKKAIMAAEHMANHIDQNLMREEGFGTLQHYWVTPIYAYVRFGKWEKILEIPKPDSDLKYPLAIWHYARGVAFTSFGNTKEAKKELKALQEISSDVNLKKITVWEINDAYSVLQIATLALEGEVEGKERNYSRAITILEKAAAMEDRLNYNEPSDWHYPIRQSLGAILLESGDFAGAERIYLEDLETFPENGWSLYGLQKALEGQDKRIEAENVKLRFERAWQWADIILYSSRVI